MDLRERKDIIELKRHPWELARFDVVTKLLKPVFAGFGTKKPNILDIGCGDLFFLNELSNKLSANFYAIDTAYTESEILNFQANQSKKNIRILNDMNRLDLTADNPAHLVFLMDVIEHIEDDEKFLKELLSKPFITTDTIFLITVPAFQSLFSSHDVFLGHYRRYSNKSLQKVFSNVQLKNEKTGYFFLTLLLFRALQKLVEKKGTIPTTDLVEWKGGTFKSTVLKNFLRIDFAFTRFCRFMGIKLPGLSNYAICRKSV